MARRALASTLVAVAAALSACGGGSSEVTPTSSVTVATSVDTTAAAVAPSVAPSLASAPTTVATTAAPATTAPPATTAAPRPGLVTLTESPMATRRESTAAGAMVKASNPAFDRSFVLTMFASDVARAVPAPGWTLTPISRDPQWTPSACGGAIRAFVGHRWEVYFDLATGPNGPDPSRAQLVAFDTRTGAMTGFLEQPNGVGWLTNSLHAYDDHTVGLLFDPSGPSARDGGPWRRLAVRRLDLATGQATDIELAGMPPEGAEDARIDGDGSVLFELGSGHVLATYRWLPGRAPVELPESPVWLLDTVDGTVLDWRAEDANGDWPIVDSAGTVLARIHSWRLMANGGEVGFVGWSRGHGYFGAFHDEPTGRVSTYLSPGVYDARTATWNWVFAPADPVQAVSYFIVGTT